MELNGKEVKVIQPTSAIINESKQLRMAAYCRVSTDSEDQENSFLAQVKYYTDYISSNKDMALVDIYADEGITGTCMDKRSEFLRLIRDASFGKIDRVLCKSVSRFARNSLECLESIRKLKEYGVSVFFENDNVDTKTMNSELILYVKSAFAQNESLSNSKRVATAYRMKMENGTFTTYCAPFGYVLENGALTVNEDEAKVIKWIFETYLSGEGTTKIVAALNRQGVSNKGKRWNTTGINYILTNEKYIGDSLTQKSYTPAELPLRNRPNKGERDRYYISNTHKPIIDREVFQKVQDLLARRRTVGRKQREKFLFTGMIECSECGLKYTRRIQNDIRYWVCTGRSRGDHSDCSGINYSEDSICRAFVRMYNKLRQFEKEIVDTTLTQLLDLRGRITLGNSEIKQIDTEIASLCEQNNRYEKYRLKNIMDEVSYREQTAVLKNRLAELRNRRSKLLSENDDEMCIENLRVLKETLRDYPSALIDFDETVFEGITDKIIAHSDGCLTFVLKGNLNLREYTQGENR